MHFGLAMGKNRVLCLFATTTHPTKASWIESAANATQTHVNFWNKEENTRSAVVLCVRIQEMNDWMSKPKFMLTAMRHEHFERQWRQHRRWQRQRQRLRRPRRSRRQKKKKKKMRNMRNTAKKRQLGVLVDEPRIKFKSGWAHCVKIPFCRICSKLASAFLAHSIDLVTAVNAYYVIHKEKLCETSQDATNEKAWGGGIIVVVVVDVIHGRRHLNDLRNGTCFRLFSLYCCHLGS